ncbi:MAG TPA: methyltransferase domain-containing protein [Gaiellaceae bacterium]|nr:methyltransferase domain-containing protein [Gaiellaceae bacterium]
MPRLPSELDARTAHDGFLPFCRDLIVEHGFRRVCEIGGGRNPLFAVAEVRELGLHYIVLDVSASELEHAPDDFEKVVGDICRIDERTISDIDFVFSHMVAEHVSDGAAMHRQIFRILRPGGMAAHLFPTLFSPVFVANRLLPDRLVDPISRRLYPTKKRFPARYSKCFGPTRGMHRMLREIGYEVVAYRPFYGTGYFERWPILGRIERSISTVGAPRRNPYLTSYVWLVVRKPGRGR